MSRTNPQLRAALLQKLGVSKQRLSQLVAARKGELMMSTPQATYTIAHDNGIDVSRYLGDAEMAELRPIITALRGAQASAPAAPSRPKNTAARKEVRVSIAGVDVGKIPVLKKAHADDARRMSERVYPLVYIFENSVRDLIEAVLSAIHGKDWWTDAVPRKVQETAEAHKAAEKKDPWHSARGGRPIDYIFLDELWAIIKHNWPSFKHLFPDQAWVQTLITKDMNVSRRVLAHMNPLGADDISNIEAAFRKWIKTLQAAQDAGKLTAH